MVKQTLMDFEADLLKQHEIWQCLSCARCSTRCPVEIDFPELVRALVIRQGSRELAAGKPPWRIAEHRQLADRTGEAAAHRLGQEVGTFRSSGDIFYFVGCLPYFDVVFHYLDLAPLESAQEHPQAPEPDGNRTGDERRRAVLRS